MTLVQTIIIINDGNITYVLKYLIEFQQSVKKSYTVCNNCRVITDHIVQNDVKATNTILFIKIDLDNSCNPNHKPQPSQIPNFS